MESIRTKLIYLLLLSPLLGWAQKPDTPVPYTLADRDRLNRVEVRLEALEDKVDILRQDMNTFQKEIREDVKTFQKEMREDMNALRKEVREDIKEVRVGIKDLRQDMTQLFLWGFGVILAAIMGLVGFMVWDRRSFMVKIEKRVTVLEQKKHMQPALE